MVGFINKESSLTPCVIRTKGTKHCQRQEAKPRFATSLVLSKLFFPGGSGLQNFGGSGRTSRPSLGKPYPSTVQLSWRHFWSRNATQWQRVPRAEGSIPSHPQTVGKRNKKHNFRLLIVNMLTKESLLIFFFFQLIFT